MKTFNTYWGAFTDKLIVLPFLFPDSNEEKKVLIELANASCSCPCAKECTAPRCCAALPKPTITRI